MDNLILQLKNQIIEVLNLEDMTSEDIDAEAPLFEMVLVSTPLMHLNS